MHSGVTHGSVIGQFLFLLSVNDLPDVLEELTLLFVDDVKMVTRRTQNMNLYKSLTAALDCSTKFVEKAYRLRSTPRGYLIL